MGMMSADAETVQPTRSSWYVLGLLLLVSALHYLDRQVVSLLLEPIRAEFDLSDSQAGMLAGTAYAVAFAICGIPIGFLVDRVHRVRLLAGLLSVWSGLTALCAFPNSYAMLLLARVGVGAAESGAMPTSLSILSDYFDRTRRSFAVGVYKVGPQLGMIVGFAVIGVVATQFSWRAAFLVAGLPGLILAVTLLLTVREPKRGQSDASSANPDTQSALPLRQALATITSQRSVVHLIMGMTISSTVAAGCMVWLPALLMRSHGASVQSAGISVGFGVATFAAISSLLSGHLADRLTARAFHRIPLLCALAAFLMIPATAGGALTDAYALVLAGFALMSVAAVAVTTPGYALCLSLAPARVRGTTIAVLQVAGNLAGFGAGPQIVGILSDALVPLTGAAHSLRYALAVFALLNLWAVFHLLRAAKWLRRPGPETTIAPDGAPDAESAFARKV